MGKSTPRKLVLALLVMAASWTAGPARAEESESLFVAAREGHVDTVRRLLAAGAATEGSGKGWSPLHVASWRGHEPIVRLLLEAGAQVDPLDSSKESPLFVAARQGRTTIVEALIAAGAEVDRRDHAEQTPLLAAARYGHAEVLRVLLRHGADVHARDASGDTALAGAALSRDPAALRVLLDAGADVDHRGRILQETALVVASMYGTTESVEALLTAGADVALADHKGLTALHHAAFQGHADVVRKLIAAGADPQRVDAGGRDAFARAASRRHVQVMALLAPYVGDLEAALIAAASCGDVFSLRVLLGRGADVTRGGPVALVRAASVGALPVVVLLLEHGVAVDARDDAGVTPLLAAVRAAAVDVVAHLLEQGADPTVVDARGEGVETLAAPSIAALERDIVHEQRKRSAPIHLPKLRVDLEDVKRRQEAIAKLLETARARQAATAEAK